MPPRNSEGFFGWRVTWAAFVVATFGWGVGFYGPPVFLHSLEVSRGWSIGLLSAAVTLHFLLGALVVAALPAIYKRLGVPATTKFCALGLAVGKPCPTYSTVAFGHCLRRASYPTGPRSDPYGSLLSPFGISHRRRS